IRSYSVGDLVEDPSGGYVKFMVVKGQTGSSKDGAYVHFMKLDRKLNIKSEKEEYLIGEGSANALPIGVYNTKDALNIITAMPGKATGTIDLKSWEFDIPSLSLRKGNGDLTSVDINGSKEYDFNTLQLKNGGFVMTMLEEGSKKQNSVLHCLWFDGTLKLTNKQTQALPYFSNKGQIIKTLTGADNEVYCLLSYPDEKDEEVLVNSLLVFANGKNQLVPLNYKDGTLVNCAIGLSKNGLLLSGLIWPGKKDYSTGLLLAKVSNDGKLEAIREESFATSLLDQLSEADTKKGVKLEYYVRSVSERTNGVVDVVMNYCSQGGGWTGFYSRTPVRSTTLYDAVIFSFENGRLASTLSLKRNIEQNTQYGGYVVMPNTFGIPEVFTQGDALYLMYFDNPGNLIGSNDGKKPKWVDFSKGTLMLARIDKNFKPTQQELIQFDKDGEFRSFYELRTNQLRDKQFILSTNKYAVFSKNVKTASILVDIN
ncbi:MAG TPA: hypothetical protein VER36_10140, partial [Flavisolibacter sp.]|nr:hypothetical protein [Flavisolibacter sp.]